jgi:hypothetical protein
MASQRSEAFISRASRLDAGSKDFPVDVRLEGDLEISRKQVIIEKLQGRTFALSCEGRNPVEVEGRDCSREIPSELQPGQVIKIGVYRIRIPVEESTKPSPEIAVEAETVPISVDTPPPASQN